VLRQSEVSEDFSIDVPVEIRVPNAKPFTQWVRSAAEPVTFSVPVRAAGARAELAPGRAILSRD
jgi:hypothetical protein